jgi:hypothetical protein
VVLKWAIKQIRIIDSRTWLNLTRQQNNKTPPCCPAIRCICSSDGIWQPKSGYWMLWHNNLPKVQWEIAFALAFLAEIASRQNMALLVQKWGLLRSSHCFTDPSGWKFTKGICKKTFYPTHQSILGLLAATLVDLWLSPLEGQKCNGLVIREATSASRTQLLVML